MKSETFEGVMENAYGKKLSQPVPFSGSFDALESYEEAREKNELPTEKEVVGFLNTKRKAAARAAAMQAALEAAGIVKPTIETDDQLRLKKMYDLLIANKSSHDEARKIAAATLNLEWAE